jgi:hypothetical protein
MYNSILSIRAAQIDLGLGFGWVFNDLCLSLYFGISDLGLTKKKQIQIKCIFRADLNLADLKN